MTTSEQPSTHADQLRACARWYARRGFPLLPLHQVLPDGSCSCRRGHACDRIAKHPRSKHGVNDASTNPDLTDFRWLQWPQANIGAATGICFDVLDIDLSDLERWQRETGYQLPETWHARSGKDGHHLYFQPAQGLGNRVKRLPFADLRVKGGYIVLPPSRNAAGAYRWEVRPGAVPLAPWPEDLLAAFVRASVPTLPPRPRPEGLAARIPAALRRFAVAGAAAGERNAQAFWLACRLRAYGADDAAGRVLLCQFAASCMPPLDEEEATRAWESSARHQGFDHVYVAPGKAVKARGPLRSPFGRSAV